MANRNRGGMGKAIRKGIWKSIPPDWKLYIIGGIALIVGIVIATICIYMYIEFSTIGNMFEQLQPQSVQVSTKEKFLKVWEVQKVATDKANSPSISDFDGSVNVSAEIFGEKTKQLNERFYYDFKALIGSMDADLDSMQPFYKAALEMTNPLHVFMHTPTETGQYIDMNYAWNSFYPFKFKAAETNRDKVRDEIIDQGISIITRDYMIANIGNIAVDKHDHTKANKCFTAKGVLTCTLDSDTYTYWGDGAMQWEGNKIVSLDWETSPVKEPSATRDTANRDVLSAGDNVFAYVESKMRGSTMQFTPYLLKKENVSGEFLVGLYAFQHMTPGLLMADSKGVNSGTATVDIWKDAEAIVKYLEELVLPENYAIIQRVAEERYQTIVEEAGNGKVTTTLQFTKGPALEILDEMGVDLSQYVCNNVLTQGICTHGTGPMTGDHSEGNRACTRWCYPVQSMLTYELLVKLYTSGGASESTTPGGGGSTSGGGSTGGTTPPSGGTTTPPSGGGTTPPSGGGTSPGGGGNDDITKIVNRDNPVDASYKPSTLVTLPSKRQLSSLAKGPFDKMVAAAMADKITLRDISTYRSYERQKELFDQYVINEKNSGKSQAEAEEAANLYSARPGTSEHQTGLVVDFNSLEDSFADTAAGKWLAANASTYGWILRFPKGCTAHTGYQFEPWHYRYVGVDLATKIKASGKCWEEYLNS